MLLIFFMLAIFAIVLGIMQKALAPQTKGDGIISDADNENLHSEYMRRKAESVDSGMSAFEYVQRQSEFEKSGNAKQNADIPKPVYSAERLKPEKQPMRNETTELKTGSAAKPRFDPYTFPSDEKPLVAHSAADCTGGSIHDGYHEGTPRKPIEAAQREGMMGRQGRTLKGKGEVHKQGVPMPGENHSIRYAPETVPAKSSGRTGADKLVAAIAKKPSIVQGVMWGEILGKPKSEID